jgi:hypothetical protein
LTLPESVTTSPKTLFLRARKSLPPVANRISFAVHDMAGSELRISMVSLVPRHSIYERVSPESER